MNAELARKRNPRRADPQSRFSQISRHWDEALGIYAARILPGEYYVTNDNEMITTVLGSCVSACIRDPATGIGGMNHFMLPGDHQNGASSMDSHDLNITRYGIAAMEILIKDIRNYGAAGNQLEIKLFGGGDVLNMQVNPIGKRNIDFVRQFVDSEAMQICAEDLGGTFPRKVNYFPSSGRVLVRRLRTLQSKAIVDRETSYGSNLIQMVSRDGIEADV